MPYSGINDPKLPEYVTDMPDDDIEDWVAIWNQEYEDCMSEDGTNSEQCEERAFSLANGLVGRKLNEPSDGITNFPQEGDDLKPSIRNSNYSEFDREWAENLKEDYPKIWRAGGNERGNEAYELWGRWRDGDDAQSVIDWLYEREDWFARHKSNGSQFSGQDAPSPNLSNISGIIAQIKWGGEGDLGESKMKEIINEVKQKQDDKTGDLRETAGYRDLPRYETKQLPTFIKSVDEDKGIVRHFISIIGNLDDGNDIIENGAFSKTIVENGRRIRVLDNHQTDSTLRVVGKPLAIAEVGRDELTPEVLEYAPDATGGLLATTKYALDTQAGRDVFSLIKGGYLPETSIGYDAIISDFEDVDRNGKQVTARILKEIRLWEYSNVIWGMNPATSTVNVKRNYGGIKTMSEDELKEDGNDIPQDEAQLNQDAEAEVRAILEGSQERIDMIMDMMGSEDFNEDTMAEMTGLLEAEIDAINTVMDLLGLSDEPEETEEYEEPEGEMQDDPEGETKIGRAISGRNQQRIQNAMDALQQSMEALSKLLEDAGISDGEGSEEMAESQDALTIENERTLLLDKLETLTKLSDLEV